jgi:hypothetical protein
VFTTLVHEAGVSWHTWVEILTLSTCLLCGPKYDT